MELSNQFKVFFIWIRINFVQMIFYIFFGRYKKIEMEDDAWESSTDVLLDRCKYLIRFYIFHTSQIKFYLEIIIVIYQLRSHFFCFV